MDCKKTRDNMPLLLAVCPVTSPLTSSGANRTETCYKDRPICKNLIPHTDHPRQLHHGLSPCRLLGPGTCSDSLAWHEGEVASCQQEPSLKNNHSDDVHSNCRDSEHCTAKEPFVPARPENGIRNLSNQKQHVTNKQGCKLSNSCTMPAL